MQPADINFGFRISDCRSRQSAIGDRSHACCLPRWWRRTLVAIATLLLCSCQLPPDSLEDFAAFIEDVASPAGPTHFIEDGGAPRLSVARSPVVIRDIDPELLEQSRPIELPTSSFGPTMFVSSGGETTDGTICICDESRANGNGLVGPSDEYLCDGGDFGLPVGVRADWTVDGLEQEDAVAHYDTLDGRVVVTPSNRVCVYAPRFAAVRRVEGLVAHERRRVVDVEILDTRLADAEETTPVATSTQRYAVTINLADRPPNLFRGREQPGGMENLMASMEAFNTLSVYANLEIIRTGQVDGSQQAALRRSVLDAVTWTGDQAVQVVLENKQAVATLGLQQPGIVYQTSEPNSPKLRLLKLASTYHALPGEEVEFTLRFDSVGDQVIGNVTIVDNLATRLEYVPRSAKSSVAATFSAVPNGAGSTVLRWEINEPLEPGDGGILQFTSRVR